MASKKASSFNISVSSDDVMFTNISTSKNGYNSATMAIKKGDEEYMSISYEWSGDTIPAFAMDLMKFMKQKGMEKSGVVPGMEQAYEEFACATCKKHNAKDTKEKVDDKDMEKKEGICETCGKKKEDCTCGKTKKAKSADEDALKEED